VKKYLLRPWKNGESNGYSKLRGDSQMPTACVLYDGKRFDEFTIVGLTIDPMIVAQVVRLMQQLDPGSLVQEGSSTKPKRRRAPLRMVHDDGDEG
jgi:hypothetical protein